MIRPLPTRLLLFAVLAGALSGAPPAVAKTHRVLKPAVLRGRQFVQDHCAGCHNATPKGRSIYPPAPPFRVLAGRYTPWGLQEVLADVAAGEHYAMPRTLVGEQEARDICAYIEALSRSDGKTQRKLTVPSCVGAAC